MRLTARLTTVGVTLGVVTASALAGSPAHATDPTFGMPQVGACYDYGMKGYDGKTNTYEPVDCTNSHTAQVIDVVMLPSSMSWSTYDKLDGEFGYTSCTKARVKTLGGTSATRILSPLRVSTFVPTDEEKTAGARWVRCDIASMAGTTLAPLPSSLQAKSHPPATQRACMTNSFDVTNCAASHVYEPVLPVYAVKLKSYPGDKAMTALANRVCQKKTKARRWGWSRPTATSWKAGERSLLCFGPR